MRTKTRLVVIILAVACPHALSRHDVHEGVGVYPQFVSEQDDIVVYETNADGTNAYLLLTCNVMGMPKPTIKWFIGNVQLATVFVLTDGSLLIPNIINGKYASILGVLYHCEATNFIGEANFSTTIRSKDINVTYAFFNGFSSTESRSIIIPVANEIDIALECDVLDANPPPAIQWLRNSKVLAEETSGNLVRYLDGGRFLYIRNIVDFSETFQCFVTNALIHQTMTSTTMYTLNGTGLQDQETYIYKEIGNVTAVVGDVDFEFSYVASEGIHDVSCDFFIGEVELVRRAAVGTIDLVALPTSGTTFPLSCRANDTVLSTGLLTVFDNAAITDPPVSNREAIVGKSNINFSCPHTGSPSTTLSWYHNGQILIGSSSVMIQNDRLFIASPQTSDSGVYQCFVKNSLSKVMASWLFEVKEPGFSDSPANILALIIAVPLILILCTSIVGDIAFIRYKCRMGKDSSSQTEMKPVELIHKESIHNESIHEESIHEDSSEPIDVEPLEPLYVEVPDAVPHPNTKGKIADGHMQQKDSEPDYNTEGNMIPEYLQLIDCELDHNKEGKMAYGHIQSTDSEPDPNTEGNIAYGLVRTTESEPDPNTVGNMAYGHVQPTESEPDPNTEGNMASTHVQPTESAQDPNNKGNKAYGQVQPTESEPDPNTK